MAAGFPRGIPAASLKQVQVDIIVIAMGRFPRGIPAASLKHVQVDIIVIAMGRFPRGIPAASLKRIGRDGQDVRLHVSLIRFGGRFSYAA